LGADDIGEITPIRSIIRSNDRAFRVWKRPSWRWKLLHQDNSISRLFVFGGWRQGKMANNVACKYRVTPTIKADTIYELETIKADLIKAGAKILRIDPIMIIAEEPPNPPKHAA
jgi:hypothetical protein